MTLPRLGEVRIIVADLEVAIEAWRAASGLIASRASDAGQATITVGDCVLRLVEAGENETPGLAGLLLTVSDAGAVSSLTGQHLASESASIEPQLSFGVPIEIEAGS
jgi:hypothetical protein